LYLLGTRVERPVVVLICDDVAELVATRKILRIALARCRSCQGRFRVLPSDVQPYKRYGLVVILSLSRVHTIDNKTLRDTAWKQFTGQTPAHSTLHAWTEGLGSFVLGRPAGTHQDAHSYSAIMAAAKSRWSQLTDPAQPAIHPRRFRSEARRERLTALASALAFASAVVAVAKIHVPETSTSLCAFRQLAITFGIPSPFSFRTGLSCTPIEQRGRRDGEAPRSPTKTGGLSCPTRTRSPPGDSNRSLPSSTPPSIARDGDA